MDWTAILLSLELAACTTFILCIAGLPIAYWLAVSRWRWKFFIEAVVALPLVLPPTVLGFYLLMAMGDHSPLGQAFTALTGSQLAFSFTSLLIGSVLFSLPFAVRPFAVAFAGVDRRLIEASWCLGVSPLATFFRITMPLAWVGILNGIILSFVHTIGEFGVVLMVGGNIEGRTRTVSLVIYNDVQSLHYAAANQTALVLLLFSFAALAATYAWQRRSWVL
ncbi:MAG TPA: molybdate ABC transporter permease subunit [Gemmataceae bacterium]|nr:molybdate ABC transporter permease subunit [Gemmataceae bacterium]